MSRRDEPLASRRWCLLGLFTWVALAAPGLTAEPAPVGSSAAIVAQWKERGVDLTTTAGIITGARIDDTTKLTDDDFRALGKLDTLRTFSSSGEGVNDRTLGFLTSLKGLEDISTNLAQFSDEGLAQFTAFSQVKQIKFFHTSLRSKNFTGAGFANLAGLKELRRLTVAGCPFNDEGMAAVAKLTQLENFRTWHTYQTEAGNQHLAALTNLKSLHLGQRLRRYDGSSNAHSLSDASIGVLTRLTNLEALTLDEARLSTSAIEQLSVLPRLTSLQLNRIDLSPPELAPLQQALPRVKIAWQPLTEADRSALERALRP